MFLLRGLNHFLLGTYGADKIKPWASTGMPGISVTTFPEPGSLIDLSGLVTSLKYSVLKSRTITHCSDLALKKNFLPFHGSGIFNPNNILSGDEIWFMPFFSSNVTHLFQLLLHKVFLEKLYSSLTYFQSHESVLSFS